MKIWVQSALQYTCVLWRRKESIWIDPLDSLLSVLSFHELQIGYSSDLHESDGREEGTLLVCKDRFDKENSSQAICSFVSLFSVI